MPALVIGSALAGAVQVLVPREALLAIGSNPALSIVAMMALAMVVSICSNVDAFFALSFASTFTPGAIVAFLLVGPLVDIKMLALMRTTFTTRTLAGIVVVVLLSAFAIGTVVNLPCVGRSGSARAGSASGSRRCSPSSRSGSRSRGRLGLYINPDSTWFAVSMAVVSLVGRASPRSRCRWAPSRITATTTAAASSERRTTTRDGHGAHGDAAPPRRPRGDRHRRDRGIRRRRAHPRAATRIAVRRVRDVARHRRATAVRGSGCRRPRGDRRHRVVRDRRLGDGVRDGDGHRRVRGGSGRAHRLRHAQRRRRLRPHAPRDHPLRHRRAVGRRADRRGRARRPRPDSGSRVTGTVRATPDGRLDIEADSVEEIPEPADPYEY